MTALRAAVLLTLVGCTEPEPPRCSTAPTSIDFGEVEVSGPAKSARIAVRNGLATEQLLKISPLSAPFAVRPADPVFLLGNMSQNLELFFLPADGLLHHDELVMSSEDGACAVSVPLRGLGSGVLRANQSRMEFVLSKRELQTRELYIENGRRVPLSLDFEAIGPVFVTFPEGRIVQPGSSLRVLVNARLEEWQRISARVNVMSAFEVLRIPIELIPSTPRVEVTPAAIDFPSVAMDLSSVPQGFADRLIRIRNAGASGDPNAPPLVIEGLFLVSDTGLDRVEVSGAPVTLGENESTQFSIRITPKIVGTREIEFHLKSNVDLVTVRVTVRSILLPPCEIEVLPSDRIALQALSDGGLEGKVNFTNVGDNNCTVDGLRLTSWTPSGFSITGAASEQFILSPQEQRQLTVAGPQQPDAGTIGAFGFHVFQTRSDIRWLALDAP